MSMPLSSLEFPATTKHVVAPSSVSVTAIEEAHKSMDDPELDDRAAYIHALVHVGEALVVELAGIREELAAIRTNGLAS